MTMKNNNHELIDVLSAISLVSGRLAKNLSILNPNPSEQMKKEIKDFLVMEKMAKTIAKNLQGEAVESLIDSIKTDMELKNEAEKLKGEMIDLFLAYFKEILLDCPSSQLLNAPHT